MPLINDRTGLGASRLEWNLPKLFRTRSGNLVTRKTRFGVAAINSHPIAVNRWRGITATLGRP